MQHQKILQIFDIESRYSKTLFASSRNAKIPPNVELSNTFVSIFSAAIVQQFIVEKLRHKIVFICEFKARRCVFVVCVCCVCLSCVSEQTAEGSVDVAGQTSLWCPAASRSLWCVAEGLCVCADLESILLTASQIDTETQN